MKRIATNTLLWLVMVAALCGCDKSSTLTYNNSVENSNISSIKYLKSLSLDTSTPITQDIIISGIVTANDYYSEFFKTIIIEDRSGAIEIQIDNWKLADLYPIGSLIMVYCNGLSLGDYGGKVVLGAAPAGEYSVDRIPDGYIKHYISISELSHSKQTPLPIVIESINSSQHIDKLICLEDIEFLKSDVSWCESFIDPETGDIDYITTVRTIKDNRGFEIDVRINYRCIYAEEKLPKGKVTINGVVGYFNKEYYIQITNKAIYF